MFFIKGGRTEKIWYYDLSTLKVGKKTPLTLAHFEDCLKLLPERADSPASWTVDFAANLQRALEEARPPQERAAVLFTRAKELEDSIREKRRGKTLPPAKVAALEAELKATERAAREAKAKAEDIQNAVYDLKAVNPNRVADEDQRTSTELLDFIDVKGREAEAALGRLRKFIG